MMKPLGWRKEPARHALAAKGISTRYSQARLERVGARGVGTAFGRRSAYSARLRRLAKGYGTPPGDVSEEDYEVVVSPLFVTLAETDELVDRGDLAHARDRLDTALDQFSSMQELFPVINDSDRSDFSSAVDTITNRLLDASRGAHRPVVPNAHAEVSQDDRQR